MRAREVSSMKDPLEFFTRCPCRFARAHELASDSPRRQDLDRTTTITKAAGKTFSRAIGLTSVIVACGTFGCSSDEPAPPAKMADEIVAIPFPSTIELASTDLAGLEPDPGNGTLTFKTVP